MPDDAKFRAWSVVGSSERVECSLSVLDNLISIVREGFRRFRHGGMEVGGILVGDRLEGLVRVVETRPLDIEYGRGAAFLLTDADHVALGALVRTTESEIASRGLEVVGYYQSHTRRGASLEETDLETYDRHFSDPQMLCMVLRPEKENATTISVYIRDERGSVFQATALEELVERRVLSPEPPKVLAQTVGGPANYEANPIPEVWALRPAPDPVVPSFPTVGKRLRWLIAIPVAAALAGGAMWIQQSRSERSRTVEAPPAATPQIPAPTPPPEQSPAPAAEVTPPPEDATTAKSKRKSKRARQSQNRRARTQTTDR